MESAGFSAEHEVFLFGKPVFFSKSTANLWLI
jgi:hypothetical protein